MQTILVVDDELPILELLRYNIEKEGFTCLCAGTGTEALILARKEKPDLIILDLMLPDMSGLDICRILSADAVTKKIPIIMVTAKTEDADIIGGLQLGAEDYVTKPFSPKVLIARIRTVLRRIEERSQTAQTDNETVEIFSLVIDPQKFEVTLDGEKVLFSATEFAILYFLAQNPGRVFSRQQLINTVKGDSYPVTERSIDVQILSLRKKLGEYGDLIETIRGVGYRMKEEKEA